MRLKRSGKSSWRSVKIADNAWYFFGNVVVKDWNLLDHEWDGEGAARGVPEQWWHDGIAPISILIVHKFKSKVSVCTTRWRWGCGSSPVCLGLGPISASWATSLGWMTAPWPTWATSNSSKYGCPPPAWNYIIISLSDMKLPRVIYFRPDLHSEKERGNLILILPWP